MFLNGLEIEGKEFNSSDLLNLSEQREIIAICQERESASSAVYDGR